MTSIHM